MWAGRRLGSSLPTSRCAAAAHLPALLFKIQPRRCKPVYVDTTGLPMSRWCSAWSLTPKTSACLVPVLPPAHTRSFHATLLLAVPC